LLVGVERVGLDRILRNLGCTGGEEEDGEGPQVTVGLAEVAELEKQRGGDALDDGDDLKGAEGGVKGLHHPILDLLLQIGLAILVEQRELEGLRAQVRLRCRDKVDQLEDVLVVEGLLDLRLRDCFAQLALRGERPRDLAEEVQTRLALQYLAVAEVRVTLRLPHQHVLSGVVQLLLLLTHKKLKLN